VAKHDEEEETEGAGKKRTGKTKRAALSKGKKEKRRQENKQK